MFDWLFGKMGYVRSELKKSVAPGVDVIEGDQGSKGGLPQFSGFAVGGDANTPHPPAQWLLDRNEYVKHFKGSVFVAVGSIARKIAMQQANVMVIRESKTGQTMEAAPERHPLVQLFREVNPQMVQYDLWFSTIVWRLVTGDAYWWKARNGFGLPAELWPLPSQWVYAVPDSEEYIGGYLVKSIFGRDAFFPADDIIHLREFAADWSSSGRFYGMPPLVASATMVDLEEAMLTRLYSQFKNFAPPGLHYETDESLEEAQIRELFSQVVNMHSMAEQSGLPIITHSGLKVSEFHQSIREMDYARSLELAMEWILAIFGVPKAVVGLVKDANRANMEASLMAFCENTINPMLMQLGQVLTQGLAREFDEKLVIQFEPCTIDDIEQVRKNVDTASKQGATTPNEVRDMLLGLPAFEDGGDTPFIAQNMVPASHGNDPNGDQQANPEDDDPEEQPNEGPDDDEEIDENPTSPANEGDDDEEFPELNVTRNGGLTNGSEVAATNFFARHLSIVPQAGDSLSMPTNGSKSTKNGKHHSSAK